jgi:hypothetical protein
MLTPEVHAWGWTTHYFIETKAEGVLSNVNPFLSNFLSTYHSTLQYWCTYPDSKKNFMPDGSGASDWHWLDAYTYNPLPYQGKYSGELPWAMEWIFDDIVQYLKDGNWVTAAQLMGAICHFAADATCPLHATYDYSPGGNGHSAYEGAVNSHISEISIPGSYVPQYLDDITNAALVTLAGSFDFTDEDPNGGVNISDYLESGISWNPTIKSITENRVRAAVQFTANVWYTAFVQAGLTNTAPTLSSGGVSPASGSPSSMFTYVVTYTDVDDNAPSYVYINVDGLQHSMSKVSGTYTGGAIYSYTAFNLDVGLHEYYFETSDGQATARLPRLSSESYSGPDVTPPNNPPSLGSGSVSPSSGRIDTTFTYEVTYADGDAPSYMNVYIDGTSHQMSEISGAYTNGATYSYTTTLGISSHTYYFETSDGQATARLPTSGNSSGPIVGLTLTTISVFPSSFTLQSGHSITLTAVLEDENSNKLSGKTITWSDNAGAFSTTSGSTDSLGQVSVTYTAPSVTTQASATISASFAGDNYYKASSGSTSGTIVPPEATILSISPSSFTLYPGYSGQIQILVATLKDTNNNALANMTIIWSATSGSLSLSSDTTDTSGQVSVTYTAPTVTAETSVTITASFAGDDQYDASSGTSSGIPATPVIENIPASTGGTVVVNVIEINVTMNLLVVLPNALSKNTTIDVVQKLPENLPTYVMVSDIFDIGPNGTTFNKPSTLTLPYNENEIPPGMSENDLAIYRRIGGENIWERIGGNVDKENHTISVQINHLSEYAVMANIGGGAAEKSETPWLTIGAVTAILAIIVIALLIKSKEKWWIKEEKKTKWR